MYKIIKSLCSVVGTNKSVAVQLYLKNKFREKGTRFVVTRGRIWGDRGLDEGGQKAQTCSYKINRYYGNNVQHD